ncbi:unnamed protein product [Malus baccata var. baccata]
MDRHFIKEMLDVRLEIPFVRLDEQLVDVLAHVRSFESLASAASLRSAAVLIPIWVFKTFLSAVRQEMEIEVCGFTIVVSKL